MSISVSLAGRIVLSAALLGLSGCASIIERTTDRISNRFENAILNQPDVEIVRQGAPTFLIMLDSMVGGEDPSPHSLASASKLYSTYASVFVDDPQRAKILSQRGKVYAQSALCGYSADYCEASKKPVPVFVEALNSANKNDLPYLYSYARALTTWVQQHTDDWSAIAELPKAEAVFEKTLELDPKFDDGNAHVYLGALSVRLPAAMGGKPEKSRQHFESALEINDNLMTRVLYAKHYARTMYDQELHDRLINEVLSRPAKQPRQTLINSLAKEQAKELAASAADYF